MENDAAMMPGTVVPVADPRMIVPVGDADLVPTMVSDIAAAKARLQELQAFVREIMVEGEDYGTLPGTEKPALYKPGAEKLCEVYGLAQVPTVIARIEDWDAPFFHYEVRCDLVSKRTGRIVGAGFGSCNSHEGRYRWRNAERICPICERPTIIKGKQEFGGGWICFRKKGGCGARYDDDDAGIIGQVVGRVENEDVATLVNTFLKMAKKRAVVDAVLSVTRSSGLFTQDEETIETKPEPPAADPAPETPKPKPERPRTGPSVGRAFRALTEAQQTILLRKAKALGITEQSVIDYIGRAYGATSLAELPFEHVNHVMEWLEQVGRSEPGANG